MDAPPSASAGSFSGTSFMILSVSVVGILATSLLLLTYYLYLTKCGLASSWRSNHHDATPTQPHRIVLVPAPVESRGLDEAAIRRIPTFRYRKQAQVPSECAVCLSEFQAGERLRLLPPCLHAFHIDCIDAWLQATPNCPLCRAALSDCHHLDIVTVLRAVDDAAAAADIVIDVASPPGGSDVGGNDHDDVAARKEHSSMGDERIVELRRKDDHRELLGVQQPMRRSLSMDSCRDKHFYLSLQKILQQQHSAAVGQDGKGRAAPPPPPAGHQGCCGGPSSPSARAGAPGPEAPFCQSETAGRHPSTQRFRIN